MTSVAQLYLNNCISYSLDNNSPSILLQSGLLNLNNSRMVKPNQSLNRIAMTPNVYYILNNVIFDKANSTLGNNFLGKVYNSEIYVDSINDINTTKLNYLSSINSDIQTQLNNKPNLNTTNTFSQNITFSGDNNFFTKINTTDIQIGGIIDLTNNFDSIQFNYPSNFLNYIGKAELSYLKNVSSDIQSQIDTLQTNLNNKPNLNTNNIFLNENTFNGTTHIAKTGNNHYFEMASVSQNNVTFMDVHCNANHNTDYDIRLSFNNDDNTNNSGKGNLNIECNRTQINNLRLTNNLILNDNTNITNSDIKQIYENKTRKYYGTVVFNPNNNPFNKIQISLTTLGIQSSINYIDYKRINISGHNPVLSSNDLIVYGANAKRSDNKSLEENTVFDEVVVWYGSQSTSLARISIIITIHE